MRKVLISVVVLLLAVACEKVVEEAPVEEVQIETQTSKETDNE